MHIQVATIETFYDMFNGPEIYSRDPVQKMVSGDGLTTALFFGIRPLFWPSFNQPGFANLGFFLPNGSLAL